MKQLLPTVGVILAAVALGISCENNNNPSTATGGGGTAGGTATAGGQGGGGEAAGGGGGTTADAGTPATFTQVYTQVIASSCSPCHTTPTGIGVTTGLLDMTSKDAAFANLVNAPAKGAACAGHGTRVVPGNADMSIMYLKVSLDDPAPCGAKMPFNLPPLSREATDMIEGWIKAGAMNN
jgi:hypothetical protein